MNSKLLSVSIASYNVGQFLNKAIESLTQDEGVLSKIEIIVVNDGSTDDTLDIANKMKESYPDTIVVIDKKNGGYGSTINSSLQIAKGKYYKLLDGDDWFYTQSIREFLDFLSSTDSDLIITPYYEVTNEYSLVDNHQEIPMNSIPIDKCDCGNPLYAMHEMTVKTEALRSLGKTIAEHCFYTDTEFVFYCFRCAETISRFSQPIYCYRLGLEGQSVSLSGTRKHHRDFLVVANRLCNVYEEMPAAEKEKKDNIYSFIIMKYMYNTFKAFMILEEPAKERDVLKQFDRDIKKKYPKAYIASGGSNLVKLLRRLRFNFYVTISKMVMKKHMNEFS